MSSRNVTIAVIIVVIILLAAVAYEKGWLNRVLPLDWQKHTKSGFVGAYGRTPGMQNCLALAGPDQSWTTFNRCTYA